MSIYPDSARLPRLAALLLVAALMGAAPLGQGIAQEQLVLKIASNESQESPRGQQLRAYGDYVEEVTRGMVRVKLLPGGVAGGAPSVLKRTQEGNMQGAVTTGTDLAGLVPAARVLSAPFLFRNKRQAQRALRGPVGRRLASNLQRKALVFGMWLPGSFRSWFGRDQAIATGPALAKLRLYARPGEEAAVRNLGAVPLSVAPQQLANLLRKKEADGFDDTILNAMRTLRYLQIRHLTLTEHSHEASLLVFSKRWFDGLPEQIQRDLRHAPTSLHDDAQRDLETTSKRLLAHMVSTGIRVQSPSAAERKALARSVKRVAHEMARSAGPEGFRLLRAARGG